ncbi:MAG: hypothetical protein LUG96_16690 [Tannerellaceae bacterium]|nr:hypothetical protein [Tannerellaceae bacterium]
MVFLRYIYPLLCISILLLTGCDTHREYEIAYTPIAPLGGQYRIYIYDQAGNEMVKDYCYIANTSDYDTDLCWLRIGEYNANPEEAWAIYGKISCDVNKLLFYGADIENLAGNLISSDETFTLTNGQLILAGFMAPSNTITDKISFTFINSRFPGEIYTAEGYRYTGWSGD